MKTICLVAAHYNPEQFGRLLEALDGSAIVAHIDATTDDTPFIREAVGKSVTFVSERVNVRWGGWSQVAATLAMLRVAAPMIEPDDYVILLSGDSYPLQSMDKIRAFLATSLGAQYINSVPMPSVELSKPVTRVSKLYVEYNPRSGKLNLLPRVINRLGVPRNYKRAFAGRRPYAGSQWWALTGEACEWIMAEVERDDRFTRFCHWAKMPDEFFFQTLIKASPYADNVHRSLMYTDWSRPRGPKPAVLDKDHIDEMSASLLVMEHQGYGIALALFARKVVDADVTEQIKVRLWPRPIHQDGGDDATN